MPDDQRSGALASAARPGSAAPMMVFLPAALLLGWAGVTALLAKPQNLALGAVLLLLAAIAGALGMPVPGADLIAPVKAGGAARLRLLRYVALGAFTLGLALSAAAFALFDRRPPQAGALLTLWLAGITLFLLAAWVYENAGAERLMPRLTRADGIALGLVAGLFALAFVARATNLEGLPINMHGDEGDMGISARAIANGEPRNPFGTGWLAFPNLWFFLQSVTLRLFGDPVIGVRMASAVVGALGIPAMYFLGKVSFNRSVGLIAAALLTVYHFHIQFSRLAVNNIGDPLFMALAIAGFIHGLRRGSLFGFAVAGVALGMLQHFYVSGRIAPIVMVIVVVHQAIVNGRQVWRCRAGLPIMILGFLVGIGPLALHYTQVPGDLVNRINTVNIFGSGYVADLQSKGVSLQTILLEQLRLGMGAYVFEPDHGSWYVSGIPLLDRLSSVLLVVGLGAAARRWRAADATVWPAWLMGVALAGGALTTNAPEVQRYVSAAPALCVLIALAIHSVAQSASSALPRLARPVRGVVTAALLGSLIVFNLTFYFRDYAAKSYRMGSGSAEETTALGRYLGQFGNDTFAYYLGGFREGPVQFLAPTLKGAEVRATVQLQSGLPVAPPAASQFVFVVMPGRAGELATLQQRFPGGAVDRVRAPSDARVLFSAYRVARK